MWAAQNAATQPVMPRSTFYHNPRCAKSREALAILREHKVEPTIVEYLQTPLTEKQLHELLDLLKVEPYEILRTKEPEYKQSGLSPKSGRAEIEAAIARFPILMERPIFVNKKKAVIARPPDRVLELL